MHSSISREFRKGQFRALKEEIREFLLRSEAARKELAGRRILICGNMLPSGADRNAENGFWKGV